MFQDILKSKCQRFRSELTVPSGRMSSVSAEEGACQVETHGEQVADLQGSVLQADGPQ